MLWSSLFHDELSYRQDGCGWTADRNFSERSDKRQSAVLGLPLESPWKFSALYCYHCRSLQSFSRWHAADLTVHNTVVGSWPLKLDPPCSNISRLDTAHSSEWPSCDLPSTRHRFLAPRLSATFQFHPLGSPNSPWAPLTCSAVCEILSFSFFAKAVILSGKC